MLKFTRGVAALHLFASTFLLAACATSQAGAPQALRLAERQSVTIAPNATLTYDSVSDSRCPPDVQCVVAGKVSYSFTLKQGSVSEQFTLTPAAPAYVSPALGKQIVLTAPPPRAPSASAPGAHPVTVEVLPR